MTTRSNLMAFAFLFLGSIVFSWHFLVLAFDLALNDDAYTYILLILPLSAALVYMERKRLPLDPHSSPRGGAVLLILAFALGCFARSRMFTVSDDVRLSLAMLALVIWWIAGFVSCFGAKTFRALVFPLFLLFALVPIPGFALAQIVQFLQQESALAARILFRIVGVPVTQNGITLSIPALYIEVAEECSSIRSSTMLAITALLFAHLFLRSVWRKIVLVLAAVPISVAKNGLRIFTIAELGTRVDPGFLNGKLHHNGGIIFFGVSVAAICGLLLILRRTEGDSLAAHASVS